MRRVKLLLGILVLVLILAQSVFASGFSNADLSETPVSVSLVKAASGKWTLTIDKSLLVGNTIRLGLTYYTLGTNFEGKTPAEQAKSLSAILKGTPLNADDEALKNYNITYTDGENKITFTAKQGFNQEYPPTFIFTSFRPADWWVDAPTSKRPYRRPDRIRPFDSWSNYLNAGSLKMIETSEPWFNVYKVSGNTYVFSEPGHDQEVISFLVIGTEKALLIDTGMGIGNLREAVEDVLKLPENSHIKIGDNFIMVNTHTHSDHRGDSWQFPEVKEICVWDGDDNASLPGDAGDTMTTIARNFFVGSGGGAITTGDLMRDLPAEFSAQLIGVSKEHPLVRPGVSASQIKRIDETHVFDLGGHKLQVVHTPGHSSDSITLIDVTDKIAFTGDFYYPGPNYVYQPGRTSLVDYYKSAAKLWSILEPLDIEWICGSHNELVYGKEIIRELRDAAKAILDLAVSGEAWTPDGKGGNISVESSSYIEYWFYSAVSPTGNIRIQVNRDYDVRKPVIPPNNP